MTYEDVGIRAKIAGLTEFERGSKRIEGHLNQIGTASTKAAADTTRAAQTMQSQITSMASGIAASLAGIGLGRFVSDLAMTAARTETLGIVLQTVGRIAGYTATELAIQEENVKKLGITAQAARLSLAQMMQAQLDVNQATKLARVAQNAAVIANENSSETMEALLHGITALQPIILRQRGIIVNLEKAYTDYAEAQGVATESLTFEMKQQIALNEVLKAGERILGTYEAAMGTAGKQWTSLPRYIEEAKNALGEAFLPAMSEGLNLMMDFLEGLTNLSEGMRATIGWSLAAGSAILTVAGPIGTIVTLMKTWQLASAASSMAQSQEAATRTAATASITAETVALGAQNAVLAQNNVLWIASRSGAITGARAIGTGISGIATPAVAAASGVSTLTLALGALGMAASGPVAIGLIGLINKIEDVGTKSRMSKMDVSELTDEYKRLGSEASKAKALLETPSMALVGPEGISDIAQAQASYSKGMTAAQDEMLKKSQFVVDAFGEEATAMEATLKPAVDIEKTMERLMKLQLEYSAQAREAYPTTMAGFGEAMEAMPEMAPKLRDAFEDLLERGPEAISKSAMEALTAAEREAINAELPKIVADLNHIIGEGLEGVSEEAQRRLELIQGPLARAFEITPRIDLEGMVNTELQRQQTAQTKASEGLEASLKAVGRELDENALAQLYLSNSMATANRSLEEQQRLVSRLEDELADAQERLRTFSTAPLVGMRALENQLFDIGQAVASVQLQMLGIQVGFTPQIAAARKETIRLRLAMLEAGDEAEEMADRGSRAMFDMLAAQKRELETGIPVFLQFYEQMAEQQEQGGTTAVESTEQEKALQAAEKQLEILELRQQLALADLQTQSDILTAEQQRVNIEKQLRFDPQLRQLQEMADTVKEITFEEAVKGIQDAQRDIVDLTLSLDSANKVLDDRQAVVDSLKIMQEGLATSANTLKIEQAEYNLRLGDTIGSYDELIDRIRTVLDLIRDGVDASRNATDAWTDDIAEAKREMDKLIRMEEGGRTADQIAKEHFSGYNMPIPGMEEGGTLARGGVVEVGERGKELAILPTGTTVLPHSAVPANISNVSSDTWNINQANQPVDVVNAVRKYQAYRRITGGR